MSKIINIHVLQNMVPGCVNRDDTNRPKTRFLGCVERNAVSSQCWKHAVRDFFSKMNDKDDMCGVRTKMFPSIMTEEIKKRNPNMDEKVITAAVNDIMSYTGMKIETAKGEKRSPQSNMIFFVGKDQISALCDVIVELYEAANGDIRVFENKKKDDSKDAVPVDRHDAYQEALQNHIPADMALFGRMVAGNKELSVDAAVSFADAVSVHEAHLDYDYFTATDDMSANAAACHIGVKEFYSATMYRTASVDVAQLIENFKGDTQKAREAVSAFLSAFIRSVPEAYKATKGTQPPPYLIYISIDKTAETLEDAFSDPVDCERNGIVRRAAEQMFTYMTQMYSMYGKPTMQFGCAMYDDVRSDMCTAIGKENMYTSVSDLLDAVIES